MSLLSKALPVLMVSLFLAEPYVVTAESVELGEAGTQAAVAEGSVGELAVAGIPPAQDSAESSPAGQMAARLAALEERVALLSEEPDASGFGDLHIHGYGELHYNNLSGSGGASDKDEIDFHRFVLFFGYDFSPRIRFYSELELEHTVSGDENPGYLQLEQGYLEADLNENHTVRAGIVILPLGLLNTTHEPTRFYGVERNRVENRIIPTTWFEGAVGLVGSPTPEWRYEAYLHSGLKTSTNSKYSVRSGRQKVAEADASDLAGTVAVSWNIPGLTVGVAVQHQSDITQGEDPEAGSAWLGEAHVDFRRGPFGVRALYAEWALDGDGPKSIDADRQNGWYVELSYRIAKAVGIFGRYSEWDEQAGSSETRSDKTQWDAGVNWWLLDNVVCKFDIQVQDNRDGKDQNGFNIGVGYEF